ncbi:peptidoglycan-binding protein [Asanoa ishikariensis]|uniref:Putative peptidoglycan binding domain-containing protein n=1 Tax=Asanoa ishikariensis TaxID=137265 RepID=A0A1H3UAJ1_9ACTN|nr:peptidoglycan-binding domain-containing protein [Asanoa ishikariensis]GIF64060.1 peptidoglycan-binding protein [Asanoa ishikariensis]SDZ58835.1 Putative peptidoglycan binding domain-containing protein [Asanoa ishikariensis]
MSRRRAGAVVALAVAAPLAAGVVYAVRSDPTSATTPTSGISTGTAEVTRGTLTQSIQIDGILAYTGTYAVSYQGSPGVLTAASRPGTTIGRGGILFRVSDAPVRLLLGAVPVYRDFGPGMTDGPDVRQLETNLVAMGFDPDHRMTVDRHFSAATAAAIRRWERAWGRQAYDRTGRLHQGQIVFLPTPLRVTALPLQVGAAMAPGATALTGTSTSRAVVGQLDTGARGRVRVGDQVKVSPPDSDPIPGRVTAIGQAATAPADSSSLDGPQQPDAATVPVTISVRLPRGFTLDEAPVTVEVTTSSRPDVLLLPIAALLARPGGGYQVRLVGGGVVPVEPGSFDETSGQVEIVGGLVEGQSVEVPAS